MRLQFQIVASLALYPVRAHYRYRTQGSPVEFQVDVFTRHFNAGFIIVFYQYRVSMNIEVAYVTIIRAHLMRQKCQNYSRLV